MYRLPSDFAAANSMPPPAASSSTLMFYGNNDGGGGGGRRAGGLIDDDDDDDYSRDEPLARSPSGGGGGGYADGYADDADKPTRPSKRAKRSKHKSRHVYNPEQEFARFQRSEESDRIFSESCATVLNVMDLVSAENRSIGRIRSGQNRATNVAAGRRTTTGGDTLVNVSLVAEGCLDSDEDDDDQKNGDRTADGDMGLGDYGNDGGDGGIGRMDLQKLTAERLRSFGALWYQLTAGAEKLNDVVYAGNRLCAAKREVLGVAFAFRFSAPKEFRASVADTLNLFHEKIFCMLGYLHVANCQQSSHKECEIDGVPRDVSASTVDDLIDETFLSTLRIGENLPRSVARDQLSTLETASKQIFASMRECWSAELSVSARLAAYAKSVFGRVARLLRQVQRVAGLPRQFTVAQTMQLYCLMFVRTFENLRQYRVNLKNLVYEGKFASWSTELLASSEPPPAVTAPPSATEPAPRTDLFEDFYGPTGTYAGGEQNAFFNGTTQFPGGNPLAPPFNSSGNFQPPTASGNFQPPATSGNPLAQPLGQFQASFPAGQTTVAHTSIAAINENDDDEYHVMMDRYIESDETNQLQDRVRDFLLNYRYFVLGDSKRLAMQASVNVDFSTHTDCAELIALTDTISDIFRTVKMIYYDEPTPRLARFVASIEREFRTNQTNSAGNSYQQQNPGANQYQPNLYQQNFTANPYQQNSGANQYQQNPGANQYQQNPGANQYQQNPGANQYQPNLYQQNFATNPYQQNSGANPYPPNPPGNPYQSNHYQTTSTTNAPQRLAMIKLRDRQSMRKLLEPSTRTNGTAAPGTSTSTAAVVPGNAATSGNLFEVEFLVRQLRDVLTTSRETTDRWYSRKVACATNAASLDANALMGQVERDVDLLNNAAFRLNDKTWPLEGNWLFAKQDVYKLTYVYALLSDKLTDMATLRKVRQTVSLYNQLLRLKFYRMAFVRVAPAKPTPPTPVAATAAAPVVDPNRENLVDIYRNLTNDLKAREGREKNVRDTIARIGKLVASVDER